MKYSFLIYSLIAFLVLACGQRSSDQESTLDSLIVVDSTAAVAPTEVSIQPTVFEYGTDAYNQAMNDAFNLRELIKQNNFWDADKFIQEHKVNINFLPLGGCYLTFLYEHANNLAAVKFLLAHQADPNQPSTVSCEEGESIDFTTTCNPEIAELLIQAGSNFALDGLMRCAASKKDFDGIRALLERGADPNLALEAASMESDIDLFKALLERGANKDEALYWAVEYDHIDLARNLIEKKAVIRRQSKIAFSDNEEFKALVVKAIDRNVYTALTGGEGFCNGSSLITLAGENKLSAVDFILKTGANPNVFCWSNSGGPECDLTSALGAAESKGNTDMVQLLKKYGATKPEACL